MTGARGGAGEAAVRSGEKATGLRYSLMDLARQREDVLTLGRGDPDLHTDPGIVEKAIELFSADTSAPTEHEDLFGTSELRRGIAEKLSRERGVTVDPETELLVTNGGQEALFLAVLAIVGEGDKVLCPDPRYTSYDQAIGLAGGEIVSIPTGGTEPFELTADAVRERAEGARLLIVVNPSNPTSALIRPDTVRAIAQVANDTGLNVISDEIYEDLVFDGQPFLSYFATDAERSRSVLVSGFSKAFAMTGFRVGYLAGPAELVQAVAAIKSTTSGACPRFSQATALAAMSVPDDPRPRFLEVYESRRRVLLDAFEAMGIPHAPHGGGLFLWADVGRLGLPADEFCYRLLDETGVLIFPGNSFGDRWTNWVRVSLLAPEDAITEAMGRMRGFVESLSTPS